MADLDEGNELEQVKETGSKIKETGQKTIEKGKKIADKLKKSQSKAGSKAFQTISKIASKLGPALPYILLVIVIIIIVVGILAFIFTMPGLITGKLKDIAQGVADWWQSLYQNQAQAFTNDDDIIEAARYIKSMGYDLVGYGFVKADEMSPESITGASGLTIGEDGYLYKNGSRFEQEDNNKAVYYDKYGIKYSTGGSEDGATGTFEVSGDIVGFTNIDKTAALLRTYVMSDKRMFLLRNDDNGNDWDWLGWFDEEKGDWANGLISIYKAKNGIAEEYYSSWEAGSIKADGESKLLTIKRGWTNNPMTFKMDGWTGRYGLSLEFLLSLHLATMAPELVSTMARTFDTEVQVYLDSVEDAQVDGLYYSKIKDDYFSIEEKDFYGWMTKKRTYEIMKNCGIQSQSEGKFKCNFKLDKTVVYANGKNGLDGEGIKETSLNDNITSRTEDYAQDRILAKSGDNGLYKSVSSAKTWADIEALAGKKESGKEVVKEGVKNYPKDFINPAISFITQDDTYKNRFVIWEDGSETKRITDYNYRYYWNASSQSKTEGYVNKNIEEVMPLADFKTVNKSFDEGGAAEFEIITFREPTKEEEPDNPYAKAEIAECQELTISILIYRTGWDANYDFLTVAYISPSQKEYSLEDNELCSNHFDDDSRTKCCDNCRKYVRTLKKALKEVHDNHFDTYIPYIARVIDSWFRDTYFVVPTVEKAKDDEAIKKAYRDHSKYYGTGTGKQKLTADGVEFIDVDDEYLKETEEYWTKYKTYDDGTDEIRYKLYVLDSNGEYEDNLNDVPESARSKCAEEDGAILYQGTEEEAEVDGVKLSKMAETSEVEGDKGWSAYKGEMIDVDAMELLEVDEYSSRNVKLATNYKPGSNPAEYDKIIYYKMSNMPEVKQIEDGKRGLTNSRIKKMFKVRKYYIYDGTAERAEAINDDWERVLSEYGCTGDEAKMNKWLDELYYSNKEVTTNLPNGDPRNPDLIGNISINKDSLSAFTILENTHTLDADYAYRDFKELIVELNYFDKEDLGDKKPEVFTWILPEITTQWPVRYVDKSEKYYGTYVHSDEALKTIKGKLGIEVEEETEETVPSVRVESDDDKKEKLENLKEAKGYVYYGETAGDASGEEDTTESTNEGESTEETTTQTTTPQATPGEVLAPVTGEILRYGTYERINTDLVEYEGLNEEDAKETVGFIQIKIMDSENYFKDLNLGDLGDTEVGVEKEDDDNKYSKIDALDLFYEEYENVCDGYTITIDGIKLLDGATDLESLIGLSDEKFVVSNSFKPNETPNIVDDEQEKKNQQKENAKAEAPAVVKKDGRIFVREGTVIGYTTKNENANSAEDYSYIRIILRNKDKAVRENVEHYFDLPEAGSNSGAPLAGAAASQEYLAWHVMTYGQLAVPACGSWCERFGDIINGERVEYTNDDTGYVPNLMPELAMIPDSQNVKHLAELGYDPSKLTSFSYVGKTGGNPVKLNDVLDTYFLYINSAADDIKNIVNRELTQYELDALIEVYIWGQAYSRRLCRLINENGTLTFNDFESINCYAGEIREEIAWKIFSSTGDKGYYANPNNLAQRAVFASTTPFDDMAIHYKPKEQIFSWSN